MAGLSKVRPRGTEVGEEVEASGPNLKTIKNSVKSFVCLYHEIMYSGNIQSQIRGKVQKSFTRV